jgi:hypothetical protein
MPIVDTVEGYRWDVPQEWIDRGSFDMPIRRIGRGGLVENFRVEFRKHDIDGFWYAVNEPPLEEPEERDPSTYDDGLEAPEFFGWELVTRANEGRHGDLYICIDPNMRAEYLTGSTPALAKASGNFGVNPDYGNTKPGPGFRIYRKKKILGPVRLLPSGKFSEPLPIP